MSDLDKLKDKYDKKEDKTSSNVKTAKNLTKELEAKKDSAPVRAVKQAVSGFRSQWSGMDDKGNVGIGKGTPGIYYDTVAIPALAGVVDDKYAPEFAVEADKKAGRIKEAIRKDMGIEAPKGALEHFANAGGTMLAQLPVPGAWLGRVLNPVKSAGIAGKVATSPIEYLSPIVDPKKINYGVGTGFGGTIGTVGEMLEEEPAKKELGGLIQKYETGGRVGKVKSFFSAVDKAIDTLKQKKGTGEQILKEIEKAPGVKKEELELRKIGEKLKDKKSITQDEVRALAAESPAPNIKPIVLGGGVDPNWQPKLTDKQKELLDIIGIEPVVNPDDPRMLGFLITETGDIIDQATLKTMKPADFGLDDTRVKELAAAREAGTITPEQLDEIRKLQRDDILLNTKILASEIQNQFLMDQRPAKFEKYTTPGGENYREILLQLESPSPSSARAALGGDPIELSPDEAAKKIGIFPDEFAEDSTILFYPSGYYIEKLKSGRYISVVENRDILSRDLTEVEDFLASGMSSELGANTPTYRGGHFDEPNVLTHARVTDRTGPNGEKVLYVEEIQSDWHQSGRSKGYQEESLRDKLTALTDERDGLVKQYRNSPELTVAEQNEMLVRMDELKKEYDKLQKVYEYGVPDAPFKKTSHELALKQILDIAAKEGYDQVAIAPGSEQVKRYNMRQELDSIRALRDDQGKITLSGIKNGRVIIDKLGIDPEDLPNYIGKERSEQILSGMGEDNIFELAGKDLEMTSKEGQGKKKIYDEILPNYLGKYAQKEFGAEPGAIDISSGRGAKTYEQYLDEINEDPYRHFDEDEIFDELHERVMDKANVKGYDFKGEDADELWDQMMTREGPFEEIWHQAEQEMYQNKAKELASKDPGESIKAFSIPVTPQMREKITGEGQKLFAAAPVVGVQGIPGMEEAQQAFDSEGSDYDYETARSSGMAPEESGENKGHWGSVTQASEEARRQYGLPEDSYMLLKGRKHETWNMAEEAEKERGAEIIKRGDRYFSVPRGSVSEEAPAEFETGGRVGAAKKAIEAAMKKAGQKKGQVAEKDLTTLQDFQTSLGDRINERVRDKMKLMDSFDYSFKPGDRVFTEWSAGNNYAPFEILSQTTTQKRFARDPNTSKILRDAEGNKVEIEPEPGYLVRHKINFKGEDIDHQYVIPQKNIKGLVEPDEPYKRGGPVGLQDGGRVGKTRAAAEKLLRVLHGGPSSVTPEAGRAMDVTTDSGYAVKRGADKMIGKEGPPMVNKFDIPSGRLLQFEEQYSPEDVALMKRYFNKLPQGQAMKGEDIWDAAQGRDVIMEGIAKAGGFAGYERPNTGAVGKGQWFRVTEPEELKRGKARGGLAQATKPL
jgi:hypothetical protein